MLVTELVSILNEMPGDSDVCSYIQLDDRSLVGFRGINLVDGNHSKGKVLLIETNE